MTHFLFSYLSFKIHFFLIVFNSAWDIGFNGFIFGCFYDIVGTFYLVYFLCLFLCVFNDVHTLAKGVAFKVLYKWSRIVLCCIFFHQCFTKLMLPFDELSIHSALLCWRLPPLTYRRRRRSRKSCWPWQLETNPTKNLRPPRMATALWMKRSLSARDLSVAVCLDVFLSYLTRRGGQTGAAAELASNWPPRSWSSFSCTVPSTKHIFPPLETVLTSHLPVAK